MGDSTEILNFQKLNRHIFFACHFGCFLWKCLYIYNLQNISITSDVQKNPWKRSLKSPMLLPISNISLDGLKVQQAQNYSYLLLKALLRVHENFWCLHFIFFFNCRYKSLECLGLFQQYQGCLKVLHDEVVWRHFDWLLLFLIKNVFIE